MDERQVFCLTLSYIKWLLLLFTSLYLHEHMIFIIEHGTNYVYSYLRNIICAPYPWCHNSYATGMDLFLFSVNHQYSPSPVHQQHSSSQAGHQHSNNTSTATSNTTSHVNMFLHFCWTNCMYVNMECIVPCWSNVNII